jgi:pSer/pThr/pTyr-binding forkhead associated (FHA) protein
MCAQYPHLLVMQGGPSAGKVYPLEGDEIFIGRKPGNTIQIDSPGVSRTHARLIFLHNQYLLEDLGSSNGTYLNGEQIVSAGLLKNGDIISLGRIIQLVYRAEWHQVSSITPEDEQSSEVGNNVKDASERLSIPPSSTSTAHSVNQSHPGSTMPMINREAHFVQEITLPQIIVVMAGQTTKTYSLNRSRLTMGSAENNEIVINSQIVSSYHACLEHMQDGYYLTVLPEASSPVFLEDKPLVTPHKLNHGDILKIGSLDPGMMVTLIYINLSQADDATSSSRTRY